MQPVASSHAEQADYDASGNATTYTDLGGVQHATTYDAANRSTQVTDGSAGTGQLSTALGLDADGQATGMNLTGQSDYAGSPFSTDEVATWNGADWLTQESTPELAASYQYDAAGFVRSQTLTAASGGVPAVQVSLAPDAADRLGSLKDGAGSTTSFGYYANDQLQTVTLPASTRIGASAEYAATGPTQDYTTTGVTVPYDGTSLTLADQYGVLANGWTASVTEPSLEPLPGGVQTQEVRHDASGRVVGGTLLLPTEYDAAGNLAQDASEVTAVRHYQYADSSHPNEVTSVDGSSSVSCAYTYTDAGGVRTIGTGGAQCLTARYTYGAANRVRSIALGDGRTVTMGYNAQGQRSRYQAQDRSGRLTLDERFGYSNGQMRLVQVLTNHGQHCKGGDKGCSELILYRRDARAPRSAPRGRFRGWQEFELVRVWGMTARR